MDEKDEETSSITRASRGSSPAVPMAVIGITLLIIVVSGISTFISSIDPDGPDGDHPMFNFLEQYDGAGFNVSIMGFTSGWNEPGLAWDEVTVRVSLNDSTILHVSLDEDAVSRISGNGSVWYIIWWGPPGQYHETGRLSPSYMETHLVNITDAALVIWDVQADNQASPGDWLRISCDPDGDGLKEIPLGTTIELIMDNEVRDDLTL